MASSDFCEFNVSIPELNWKKLIQLNIKEKIHEILYKIIYQCFEGCNAETVNEIIEDMASYGLFYYTLDDKGYSRHEFKKEYEIVSKFSPKYLKELKPPMNLMIERVGKTPSEFRRLNEKDYFTRFLNKNQKIKKERGLFNRIEVNMNEESGNKAILHRKAKNTSPKVLADVKTRKNSASPVVKQKIQDMKAKIKLEHMKNSEKNKRLKLYQSRITSLSSIQLVTTGSLFSSVIFYFIYFIMQY